MDAAEAISVDSARGLLNRAIEALLSDHSIQQRVADANRYIRKLQQYPHKIPADFDVLKRIVDDLDPLAGDCPDAHLASAQELALTERLLTLYVQVSDGALVF